jgi:hypothetical protein
VSKELDVRCLHLTAKRMSRSCRHVIEDALFEWELGEVEREFCEIILGQLKQLLKGDERAK